MKGCNTCIHNKKMVLSNGTEHSYCNIDNEIAHWTWHNLEKKPPTEERKRIQQELVQECYEGNKSE